MSTQECHVDTPNGQASVQGRPSEICEVRVGDIDRVSLDDLNWHRRKKVKKAITGTPDLAESGREQVQSPDSSKVSPSAPARTDEEMDTRTAAERDRAEKAAQTVRANAYSG